MTFKPTEFIFQAPDEEELNVLVAEVCTAEFPGQKITPDLAASVRNAILDQLMTEQALEAIEGS
jgi:hypothetical protein